MHRLCEEIGPPPYRICSAIITGKTMMQVEPKPPGILPSSYSAPHRAGAGDCHARGWVADELRLIPLIS